MLRLLKEVAVVGRGVVEPEAVEQWAATKTRVVPACANPWAAEASYHNR